MVLQTFDEMSQGKVIKRRYAGLLHDQPTNHSSLFTGKMEEYGAVKILEEGDFRPTNRLTQEGIDLTNIVYQLGGGRVIYQANETSESLRLWVGISAPTITECRKIEEILQNDDFHALLPPGNNKII